ncbi:Clp protease N-terminal domain-containing protein [Nonomuraea dietziae]|uniref:Clp R domain-containing protein n=1 Tax=Nonomuraea dietziae TaxID=65515 RepID=A0A7W5VD36_9ACTN|nr:hypothetical protein [Nonomuraea dietziae]
MTLKSLGISIGDMRTLTTRADLGNILEQVRREAAGLGHLYIGTEHLLLGVIREEGTEAPGVGLQQVRDQIIQLLHGSVV